MTSDVTFHDLEAVLQALIGKSQVAGLDGVAVTGPGPHIAACHPRAQRVRKVVSLIPWKHWVMAEETCFISTSTSHILPQIVISVNVQIVSCIATSNSTVSSEYTHVNAVGP